MNVVSVPAAGFIEAANDQLKQLEPDVRVRQVAELKSAVPHVTPQFVEGYLLGLQTARVFLATNPKYAELPIL